ncbi:MAG TPA: hypothetical protein VLA88_05340 [Candidatus Saccharimonadales bacterium]|nr:hypothetical protein [Candidatus Saccharimonadales bacterium]
MRVRGQSNIGIIILTVLATVTIVALGASAVYLFMQNRDLKRQVSDFAETEKAFNDLKKTSPQYVGGLNGAENIIKQVSLMAELPQTEVPTMVPIDDREKVKTIEFFKNAQNGDYVLVYQQNKFAVLYRPTTFKIINMGPQTFSLGNR